MARPLTADIRADRTALDVAAYEAAGGYQGLRKAVGMTPVQVQQTVTASGLRGRGGAGFPTGMKWSFVPMGDGDGHRYLVVNADEKEPGTMKDRWLMEGNPHQLLEGALIAAWAMQADIAYIFLRREYRKCAASLEKAIEEARGRGYIGEHVLGTGWNLQMRMHLSAGRYMCGEESGLLNALEGRRAIPRNKPPFPQVSGLWGRPTVVNNVETLSNVPHILREGPEWYKALSPSPDSGTKIFGVSGKVKRPGLWELPMGTTIREILMDHAGGMADGHDAAGAHPRRRLHGLPLRGAARREDGLRLGGQGGKPSRHGDHGVAGRPDLRGGHGALPGEVLRPGVLRLVHAVPRRPALGGAGPRMRWSRERASRRTSRYWRSTCASWPRAARSARWPPARWSRWAAP